MKIILQPGTQRRQEMGSRDADVEDRCLEAGSLIAKRYRIVSLLGTGGMGEVYRADDLVLAQPVALKFLPKVLSTSRRWRERLVKEACITREITHPNICRVHDIEFAEATGEAFISMEYVDGEDLRSLLRRIGRFPQERACEVARQTCVGLAAAHAKGILHRDLKPANIMIDGDGQVRITDFGLAARRAQIDEDEIRAGTPGYMAPELFAGTDVSVSSDIYALGLVLYELFTGQAAFQADSVAAFARLHQREKPKPPSELVRDIAPAVERLIQQCLEKDPSHRPLSALAVAAALPGSDSLELALAAGLTPSPSFVAAASRGGGLRTAVAAGMLAAFVAVLAAVVLLAAPSGLAPDFSDAKPPSVLSERATQIVQALGYADVASDETLGFSYWPATGFLARSGLARRSGNARFASANPAQFKFWHRQSPLSLAPVTPLNITFGRARTTLSDPPRTEPGMITLILDAGGMLLGFEALPPYPAEQQQIGPPLDSSLLFDAAGLDPADYKIDGPLLRPLTDGVQQLAWIPRKPATSLVPKRIEAATLRGRPVFFAVLEHAPEIPATARHFDTTLRRAIGIRARIILLMIAAIGAIPLAWLNLKRDRRDRAGALRLAGVVFAARLAVWGLGTSHAQKFDAELILLLFAVLGAMFESGLVWLFYVALEPSVRRFWPQTIVAWSRVLAGRWHDPLVARDLLAGALLGVTLALIFELDWIVLGWIGWEVRDPLRLTAALEPLLGARHALAACIQSVLAAIYFGLYLVTLLVIARVLLRKTWLAGLVTIIATIPVYLPQTGHPGISWIPLGLALLLVVWAATRFGLIVVACAALVSRLLLTLPLNFNPGAWAWDLSLFVLLVVGGIAVFGFAIARGRAAVGPESANRSG